MTGRQKTSRDEIERDIKRAWKILSKQGLSSSSPRYKVEGNAIRTSVGEGGGRFYSGEYETIYNTVKEGSAYTILVDKVDFFDEDSPESLNSNTSTAETMPPSFFEFLYTFEKNVCVAARMTFFPAPSFGKNCIRVDFGSAATGSHSKCHLQLYPTEAFRIPMTRLPPPSAFIDFCLESFFRAEWAKVHQDLVRHEIALESLFVETASITGLLMEFKRRFNDL